MGFPGSVKPLSLDTRLCEGWPGGGVCDRKDLMTFLKYHFYFIVSYQDSFFLSFGILQGQAIKVLKFQHFIPI